MNRFGWLLRRELWENRSIWLAPLIAVAALTLISLFGLRGLEQVQIDQHFDEDKRQKLVAAIYVGVTMLFFLVAMISSFFYSLDALYGDRRDRSILFWKSLPLSDVETVLSKAVTALVVIPLAAAAGALLGQWGVALAGTLKFGSAMMLEPTALLAGAVFAIYGAVAFMLWYAPLVAYLLAWSAWAPRSPFLYAIVPPVVLSVIEKLVFGSDHVWRLLADRTFGAGRALALGDAEGLGLVFNGEERQVRGFDAVSHMAQEFFATPELWLGLVAAAALLAATVWIRRYRDESL